MKIFQVNDKFFFEGGSEIYIRQISALLKELGHTIIIIYGDGPKIEEVKKEGFLAYKIPGLEEEFPTNKEEVLAEIERITRVEKPDIVQINNIQNGYFVNEFLVNAPTMRHVHDHRLYCPGFSKTYYNSNQVCPIPFSVNCLINAYKEHCATNKPVKLLRKYQAKFYELEVNKKLPKILLASDFMASQLKINDFDLKKVTILPHPVDMPSKITPLTKKRQVLFVGRITMEKGPQYSIEAMKMIDGTLTIAGDGPQLNEYKELAKSFGVDKKVRFVGDVKKAQLARYYQEADVLVFPSIWPEPHGKTGPEAMSFGRSVVGFDCGGVSEWLKDSFNGYLVNRLDIETLATRINYLLDNPEVNAQMGKNGRELVEKNMNQKDYVKKVLQLYQDTIRVWKKEMVFA